MRLHYLVLTLFLNSFLYSQKLKFYKPGSTPVMFDNACLLLKKGDKSLQNIHKDSYYKLYRHVKLVGFNETDFNLDSICQYVSEKINPTNLIIENCDLSILSGSFARFSNLKDLELSGNYGLDENQLFHLLKNNAINSIKLQTESSELISDSLHLLKELKSISLSNNGRYSRVNKTEYLQLLVGGNLNKVAISYCDNFYRMPPPNNLAVENKKRIAKPKSEFKNSYDCIRQPIPGISINDTVYRLSATKATALTYESGSIIHIDKSAFVYPDGKPYKGPVELFYREFRNPVEIMLSGIPMTVKDLDTVHLFKSGGMYEIYANDKQGNELRTVSDTSIKIKFALTDTSMDYNLYSLSPNGTWNNKSAATGTSTSGADKKLMSKALKAYLSSLNIARSKVADTTRYLRRFENTNYLCAFRKDNLRPKRDSIRLIDSPGRREIFSSSTRGLFRIRYLGKTQDKKILFTLEPALPYMREIPRHIRILFNKTFLYEGTMDADAFKKHYVRRKYYWDLRADSEGELLEINLKLLNSFETLNASAINLFGDNTYSLLPKINKSIVRRIQMAVNIDARKFDKRSRQSASNYNNLNGKYKYMDVQLAAYNKCREFQTEAEKKMGFRAWKRYANRYTFQYYSGSFITDTEVGEALVKSGLGINNIDCYIHSGEMEPFYVNYQNVDKDSLSDQYNAILFKSINTIYPIYMTGYNELALSGYYYKNKPNYVIRFSNDGHMQITRPEDLKELKSGDAVNLDYKNDYSIKGLSSDEISKIIFN
ncbi:MAG: hypothetical protein IT236_06460 [Bacteroidia bacterium]|nr:hypothetical protein [Bacteroidia bacterium]